MTDRRLAEFEHGSIDTVLGDDVEFEGELTFERSLIVKGSVKGKVTATGILYVDEQATVSARVEVERLRCKGRVTGHMTARSGVELYSTANVAGEVVTPDLAVESGCRLNGRCVMDDAPAASPGAPPALPEPGAGGGES